MPKESLDRLRTLLCEEYNAEHWAATIALADRILRREPEDAPTLIRLGEALSRLFNHDEAENVLRKAIDCGDKKLRNIIYGKMEHLFINRCDVDSAARWYQKAIESAPHDAAGYIFLGVAHAKQGNLVDAENVFRKGSQCPDGCIDEAYYNLGTMLRCQGRLHEAQDCYLRALELDPEYRNAQVAMDDVSAAIKYSAPPDV